MPDCVAAADLLRILPSGVNVVEGDKGYDSNAVRRQIVEAGVRRTSRQRATAATALYPPRPFTGTATPSTAPSAGSRISAASPPAMTA